MASAPKNPAVERVAGVPFDKDCVSPVPQIAPRARDAAANRRTKSADQPAADPAPQPGREEYPGPQTASSGLRAEPGRPQPTKSRDRRSTP